MIAGAGIEMQFEMDGADAVFNDEVTSLLHHTSC